MTLITIYSLFLDDIRLIFLPKAADTVFFGLTLISLLAFSVEIFLGCLSIDGYFNSFFFWLELIATLSLIPDCGWIWYSITQQGNALLVSGITTDLVKSSRAARVLRTIRIVRFMRLIRFVELYKQLKAAEKKRLKAINEQRSETRILRKKNMALAKHFKDHPQSSLAPILDSDGGTGGAAERSDSLDSLEREMEEIDMSNLAPKDAPPQSEGLSKSMREFSEANRASTQDF